MPLRNTSGKTASSPNRFRMNVIVYTSTLALRWRINPCMPDSAAVAATIKSSALNVDGSATLKACVAKGICGYEWFEYLIDCRSDVTGFEVWRVSLAGHVGARLRGTYTDHS